jgi:hypothetical protein
MALDALSPYYGDRCPRCGKEERALNRRWCTTCLEASQKWQEAYAATVWAEEMAYVSPERKPFLTPTPPPPPPTDPMPTQVCRHCSGNKGWVPNAGGAWACAVCGWPT